MKEGVFASYFLFGTLFKCPEIILRHEQNFILESIEFYSLLIVTIKLYLLILAYVYVAPKTLIMKKSIIIENTANTEILIVRKGTRHTKKKTSKIY